MRRESTQGLLNIDVKVFNQTVLTKRLQDERQVTTISGLKLPICNHTILSQPFLCTLEQIIVPSTESEELSTRVRLNRLEYSQKKSNPYFKNI